MVIWWNYLLKMVCFLSLLLMALASSIIRDNFIASHCGGAEDGAGVEPTLERSSNNNNNSLNNMKMRGRRTFSFVLCLQTPEKYSAYALFLLQDIPTVCVTIFIVHFNVCTAFHSTHFSLERKILVDESMTTSCVTLCRNLSLFFGGKFDEQTDTFITMTTEPTNFRGVITPEGSFPLDFSKFLSNLPLLGLQSLNDFGVPYVMVCHGLERRGR